MEISVYERSQDKVIRLESENEELKKEKEFLKNQLEKEYAKKIKDIYNMFLMMFRGTSIVVGIPTLVSFILADAARANALQWFCDRKDNIMNLWEIWREKGSALNNIAFIAISIVGVLVILAATGFICYFVGKKIGNIFTYARDTAKHRIALSISAIIGLFWSCIIGYDIIKLLPMSVNIITVWLILSAIAFMIINRNELKYVTHY